MSDVGAAYAAEARQDGEGGSGGGSKESGVGFTPGPWACVPEGGAYDITAPDPEGSDMPLRIASLVEWDPEWRGEQIATAHLIAAAPDMLAALNAAAGYLLNAKIDIETGAPRRTAVRTIEGGLKIVREAVAKATPASQGNASPSPIDRTNSD